MPIRPTKSVIAKKHSTRSSSKARKLCRLYLKKMKTERAAAAALKISPAKFHLVMTGQRKEPPEVRAAIKRADMRAARAWRRIADEIPDSDKVDRYIIAELWRELNTITTKFKKHLPSLEPPAE